MANANGWGDGSVNNNIGWGQGANNTIGWGKSHLDSWSGATDIDGGNLPSNSVAPAITGTAQEGQTLTCSTGTWSGSPTYTYQWKRNGNNIGGATSSTYLVALADVGQNILCTVTATNFVGSANANSNTVVPVSAFSFLLDTYSGAAGAYSLRKLRSAYTGDCIRVRRSSDNTEQNIGFVNNVLDTASLLTFCGAGNGFVTTWYDQSGNGVNASQSTAGNQPRIVNAGVLETLAGKSSIYFAGIQGLIHTLTNSGSPAFFYTGVSSLSTTTSRYVGVFGTSNMMVLSKIPTINKWGTYGSGNQAANTNIENAGAKLLTMDSTNNTSGTFYLNNVSDGTFGSTSGNNIRNIGGDYASAGQGLLGYVSEVVFYTSNQSSNRNGINTNILTYYGL